MKIIQILLVTFVLSANAQNLALVESERFIIDLKYASDQNFLKKNVYQAFGISQCFIRPEIKEKLEKLIPILKKEKLKLVLWDCYRPVEVQEAMWKLVPDPRYVADPKVGSNHNRGAAIDVALADESGLVLEFPTGFDDFSPRAWRTYSCKTNEKKACENRDRLQEWMVSLGLEAFPTEWWHFQLKTTEPTK